MITPPDEISFTVNSALPPWASADIQGPDVSFEQMNTSVHEQLIPALNGVQFCQHRGESGRKLFWGSEGGGYVSFITVSIMSM